MNAKAQFFLFRCTDLMDGNISPGQWKVMLTWLDCCCCHPPACTDTQQKLQFFHIVGTIPGLYPGFCNLSTYFVFTAYSYVLKASNDKTKVDTWVHLGQQPQKTFNTPTVNSLTPVWPLFSQHPVPFSVLFFTFPFFYSDIYISSYERMIFCLFWFEQKTHTLKHNTTTVMG